MLDNTARVGVEYQVERCLRPPAKSAVSQMTLLPLVIVLAALINRYCRLSYGSHLFLDLAT
jgi:hypothetical protein